MSELIQLHAQPDHVIQWTKLKRLYIEKRGSDVGQANKPIPRTTNGDIAELTKWWHKEFTRGVLQNPWGSKPSQKRWKEAKQKIERDLKGATLTAQYPDNEWLWQDATRRVSIYLESIKAVPSPSELLFESVKETLAERAQDAADLAEGAADVVTDTGKRAASMLKTGDHRGQRARSRDRRAARDPSHAKGLNHE